ncbi:MAG: LytTR family DNA-binding domain-containing protein [Bacteroidota bacterium]
MNIIKLLNAPLPSPERSLHKLIWILLLGVGCSLFIFLYNPFGIANEKGELYSYLILFSLGIIFSMSIILMEWTIPSLFPRFFQKWTITKALIWYSLVILFAGAINFLYKSYLGGFSEFTLLEFFFVLLRTIVISCTVAFFIVGLLHFLNRKRLTAIASGQQFQITSGDGKTVNIDLHKVLYVSSDNNYVDMHYRMNGKREKLILRSSLKNIEEQIVNPISPIVRCHRQFLINTNQFEIEKATSRSMIIRLKNDSDEISVSSKYIPAIKKLMTIRP